MSPWQHLVTPYGVNQNSSDAVLTQLVDEVLAQLVEYEDFNTTCRI